MRFLLLSNLECLPSRAGGVSRFCLETCFQTLADTPMIGRSVAAFAPELRRYEIQSHVVFYRPEDPGALLYPCCTRAGIILATFKQTSRYITTVSAFRSIA